jgi:hypothetical protein
MVSSSCGRIKKGNRGKKKEGLPSLLDAPPFWGGWRKILNFKP